MTEIGEIIANLLILYVNILTSASQKRNIKLLNLFCKLSRVAPFGHPIPLLVCFCYQFLNWLVFVRVFSVVPFNFGDGLLNRTGKSFIRLTRHIKHMKTSQGYCLLGSKIGVIVYYICRINIEIPERKIKDVIRFSGCLVVTEDIQIIVPAGDIASFGCCLTDAEI